MGTYRTPSPPEGLSRVDIACLLLRMFEDADFVLWCLANPMPIVDRAPTHGFFSRTNDGPNLTPFTVRFTAGGGADALMQCRNLTRYQETSPETVRDVGNRVGEIVNAALRGES